MLHPLLVCLNGVGVPVIDPGAKWKRAFTREDGQVYDFSFGKDGNMVQSTRPILREDETDPKKVHMRVGDDATGHRLLRQFVESGKYRIASRGERSWVDFGDVKLEIGLGSDLRRAALKSSFACAVKFFPGETPRFTQAREDLANTDAASMPGSVSADLRSHPRLDEQRADLCHVVYIEQSDSVIHGVVQYFGAFQLWIELSNDAVQPHDCAIIGTLDPISCEESFRTIEPLRIPPCRTALVDGALPIRKFNASAYKRGAKRPETLKLTAVNVVGIEMRPSLGVFFPPSWTGDVPKKKWP
jgi:hypothetical protein